MLREVCRTSLMLIRAASASGSRRQTSDVARSNRLHGFTDPTVFCEFTPLAMKLNALNLGQGFPNFESPGFVKEAALAAVSANENQYCRSAGHPALVNAISSAYAPEFGHPIDPLKEVVVTCGATQGIAAAVHALIEPGDEAVLLEPAYDSYAPSVGMAGGTCRFVPLRNLHKTEERSCTVGASDFFSLDMDELRAAVGPRTRVLILNTPHNPTGKLFTLKEMQGIADIVAAHPNLTVIADEVYEKVLCGPEGGLPKHIHFASLPGMKHRTVTVSSLGKTFSCTGWKIGWCIGEERVIARIMTMVRWTQFCTATPLQVAAAATIKQATNPYGSHPSFYSSLSVDFTKKRDMLMDALAASGLRPIRPDGGYFIMAQTDHLTVPQQYLDTSTEACPVMTRDWALCRWLACEAGVVAIPPSAFYSGPHKGLAAGYARFAYCKEDGSLQAAKEKLAQFFATST